MYKIECFCIYCKILALIKIHKIDKNLRINNNINNNLIFVIQPN